ncbi:MAG: lipid-A-disaccharide synthase [Chitinispirillia bacterium]|nr:lipid-A-disaccharide synthase [Chitinispirillia bacterium]MCL2241459.1 lipid-A-disaccharide synthase [Chitinispirillia bacterium]
MSSAPKQSGSARAPTVMFIAGEPSGDMHAAAVINKLKGIRGDINIWGIGGPKMAAAGLEQVMPFEPFNRMGYVEVLSGLPFFLNAKKKLIRMMSTSRRPDVLVCVDYSGFNMPMMKAARGLGIPVVWYIAPMVWAWKRKRAEVLGNQASHIAVIFPFEAKYFSPYPAPVTFVGNPLTESLPPIDTSFKKFPAGGDFRLAIVPGSRSQEIKNMLGVMLGAADLLVKKHPRVKVAVSKFSRFDDRQFRKASELGFELFDGPLPELIRQSDLALITSGTATLETALLGVPMVISYRTSPLTYAIYKSFVKIGHIGLPNIITGTTVVPECIQNDASPEKLFAEMDKFVSTPSYWENAAKSLLSLRSKLGEKTPSSEVADILYSYLG